MRAAGRRVGGRVTETTARQITIFHPLSTDGSSSIDDSAMSSPLHPYARCAPPPPPPRYERARAVMPGERRSESRPAIFPLCQNRARGRAGRGRTMAVGPPCRWPRVLSSRHTCYPNKPAQTRRARHIHTGCGRVGRKGCRPSPGGKEGCWPEQARQAAPWQRPCSLALALPRVRVVTPTRVPTPLGRLTISGAQDGPDEGGRPRCC